MSGFMQWFQRGAKRVAAVFGITINFNAPVTFNFGGHGNSPSAQQHYPQTLNITPQAERPRLKIRLAPPRRQHLLSQPADPNIRASWVATMKSL